MGKTTGISWCDHTFNPFWGCQKVSEGCVGCYAEATSNRWGFNIWGPTAERRFFGDKHWKEPLAWNREAIAAGVRRRVFTGSMCDIMEDRRELDAPRQRLYELIIATPGLDWLLCTHRPENYLTLLPREWIYARYPRHNVWLLATVENDKYLDRIDVLRDMPAVVRGLSVEPLLGPIEFGRRLVGIEWTIIGGESGPNARPCDVAWIRSIIKQCQKAGTRAFVKQLGSNPRDGGFGDPLRDRKGADPSEWSADLRIQEFPAVCLTIHRTEGKGGLISV